jgi:Ca2+-binding RTX toxin-like protein
VDVITSFVAADDRLEVENGVFTKLTTLGLLSSANFRASSIGTAADDNDFICYETDTGKLFYDGDGNGSGSAIQIATLTGAPLLTSADIFES